MSSLLQRAKWAHRTIKTSSLWDSLTSRVNPRETHISLCENLGICNVNLLPFSKDIHLFPSSKKPVINNAHMNMVWVSGGYSRSRPDQRTAEAGQKKAHGCDRMFLNELQLSPFLFLFPSCFGWWCTAEYGVCSTVLLLSYPLQTAVGPIWPTQAISTGECLSGMCWTGSVFLRLGCETVC